MILPVSALALVVVADLLYGTGHLVVMSAPNAPVGAAARALIAARELVLSPGAVTLTIAALLLDAPAAGLVAVACALGSLAAGAVLGLGAPLVRARYEAQDTHAQAGRVLVAHGRAQVDRAALIAAAEAQARTSLNRAVERTGNHRLEA